MDTFPVSVDSAVLETLCYQWTNSGFVSADCKRVKVLYLEQIASADSKGDRRALAAVRVALAELGAKSHDP
jgi:hypothetical protein